MVWFLKNKWSVVLKGELEEKTAWAVRIDTKLCRVRGGIVTWKSGWFVEYLGPACTSIKCRIISFLSTFIECGAVVRCWTDAGGARLFYRRTIRTSSSVGSLYALLLISLSPRARKDEPLLGSCYEMAVVTAEDVCSETTCLFTASQELNLEDL